MPVKNFFAQLLLLGGYKIPLTRISNNLQANHKIFDLSRGEVTIFHLPLNYSFLLLQFGEKKSKIL